MSYYVIDGRRYYAELDSVEARGVHAGICAAAQHILAMASAAFAEGDDDEARALRDIARGLTLLAEKRKPGPCPAVGALPIADLDNPDEMAALRAAAEEYV